MKNIIEPILNKLGVKYQLKVKEILADIIELENDKIIIEIINKIGDFSFSVKRKNDMKVIHLSDFIELKYPNYFSRMSDFNIYHLKQNEFDNSWEYLIYLIQTSLDFLESEFPEVFDGKF